MNWDAEGTSYEEKSRYNHVPRKRLELVKTIVAFANTAGGQIFIREVACRPADLDSARLDDLVNKYVEPRLGGLTSYAVGYGWIVEVPRSPDRPHIFVRTGTYDEGTRQKTAFHPGQVYVRHSSKTEPAVGDDLRQVLQERGGDWLSKVGQAISRFSLRLEEEGSALPVRLSRTEAALTISISDPNQDFPYTTKTLGQEIGEGQNWVAKAAEVLGLKDDPRHCCPIRGASGQIAVRRYSEEARRFLEARLSREPDFDPYHAVDP